MLACGLVGGRALGMLIGVLIGVLLLGGSIARRWFWARAAGHAS